MLKNQSGALRGSEPSFNEGQITILVTAVNFVADNRMAEVGEVDAELVLAAGARQQTEQGKRRWRTEA